MRVAVRAVTTLDGIEALAAQAEREGYRFVSRLLDEWIQGRNRFDAPGERLFVAAFRSQVVGVCGLNIDPYVSETQIGRVRRLYVAPSFRRMGVGSALLHTVFRQAHGHFRTLRLRTNNPDAARFYEWFGFSVIEDDDTCTHRSAVA